MISSFDDEKVRDTMKALVVYESFFGNTEKIAQAIAGGLAAHFEVTVLRVADARPEQFKGFDLVVIGSPTRGFQPSDGTKALLKTLPAGALQGIKVAAFDTRMDVKEVNNAFLTFMERIFGYAAEPIGRKLAAAGGTLALKPEGFFVHGSEGPLWDGEIERAEKWGEKIAVSD
ncbi:flavodoxins [Longilinea arvoryzae]|uniref:Flavodoxins n=1 Tax=Longilinea arvoryzae TaxID=360412 RepID=A0A0S7BF12_9CHLR|nr:flavodoxin family protein [Longilinea arvoryzae]GAP12379.1 flavodoxins [Longilinea arvoryzae]